jgi:hypothetical protein
MRASSTDSSDNSKNWQLAVPKLLFFLFGGPIAGLVAAFTGLGLHGAWWLIDVVMWGVGYYTTHTYWGNPTEGKSDAL